MNALSQFFETAKTIATVNGITYTDNTQTNEPVIVKSLGDPNIRQGMIIKYEDGLGEVLYRTEYTTIVREFDSKNKLTSSEESYRIFRHYDSEIKFTSGEKQEVEIKEYKFDGCTFIKSEDGSLKVYGIYSNHYQDVEGDILTAESHKYFVENVQKGVFDLPEIYIAHMPVSVGKCEVVDYDERGFAIFGGTIHKEWQNEVEEIVSKSFDAGIDLGLSHGFPTSSVEYDDEGYITKYQSVEVSILPIRNTYVDKNGNTIKMVSAANKYTQLLSE